MKNQRLPLVSVIVITYNSSKFVLETLESIKNQTYRNLELIISDDSSTDNTVELCKEWIAKNQTRFSNFKLVVAEVNQGIPANCNRGVKNSNGEWIRIVGGDDALISDSIEKYIRFIDDNGLRNVEVLHSNVERFTESFSDENRQPFQPLAHKKLNDPNLTAEEQFQVLLRTNTVLAGTLFIKRIVFEKVGLYDEGPRLWEDRPMLIKMTYNGIKLHYIDFPSLNYRRHTSSVQRTKKSNKFLPDYIIIKSSYYYKNYRHFLPFCERMVATILLQRIILFDKLKLNKDRFINRVFFKIIGFPWTYFSFLYRRKYL